MVLSWCCRWTDGDEFGYESVVKAMAMGACASTLESHVLSLLKASWLLTFQTCWLAGHAAQVRTTATSALVCM
jgi:hypothetical protein